MNAEKLQLGNEPSNNGENIFPQARLTLMETPEGGENSALTASFQDKFPEPAPGDIPEPSQTLDTLLHAICDTETARRLERDLPAGFRQPPAPAAMASSAAATPVPTLLVKASPQVASAGLMPPPSARPRRSEAAAASTDSKNHDTRAYLLRAIRTTETARSLKHEMPTRAHRSETPAPTPPLKTPIPISGGKAVPPLSPADVQQPPAPTVMRKDTSTSPAPTLLVQASPHGGSPWLMPPPDAPSRRPMHPKATVARPLAIVPPAAATSHTTLTESAPAVALPTPFTSFQKDSSTAPFPFSRQADIARHSVRLGRLTAGTVRFGSQLALLLKQWLESKAIPAVESTARASLHLSAGLKNRVVEDAAPAFGCAARGISRRSIRLMRWSGTKAASALGSTGRASSQLSARLKISFTRDPASATERAVRTASQPPVRIVNTPAIEAADTAKSMVRPRPQVASVLKDWLGPRRCRRLIEPPVVAYCWTADTPHSLKVADISSGGVHLLTDVRWPLGGRLSMTLQRTDRAKESPDSWIVIDFMVLRWCRDGVAGAFIPSNHPLSRYAVSHAENCADPQTLKHFVKRLAVTG